MFCACGSYIPHKKCKVCNLHSEKKQIKSEKYYIIQEDIKNIDKGAKIAEICPKCGNEEMYYKAVQLRSADEGQTIFYECDCGYRFSVNT